MATLVSDIDGTIVRNGVVPIQSTINYINKQRGAGSRLVVITGRPEDNRAETETLLNKIIGHPYRLLMNHLGTAHDLQVKSKDENFKSLGAVDIAIDNDPLVRKVYKLDGAGTVLDPAKL